MNKKYDQVRPNIPAEIARAIKIESGHRCAVNRCEEHTYVEFHHIDENRENNALENLILLCVKHHKMAHAKDIARKDLYRYKSLLQNSRHDCIHSFETETIPNGAQLNIVDIYEVDRDAEEFEEEPQVTIIELKLRNSGSEVAFLKEIRFTTKQHWQIDTDRAHSLVQVSAEYDLEILDRPGAERKLKVHHEIKSQETDRLRFKLAAKYSSDPDGLSLYLLNIEAVYNENSKRTIGAPIIVNILPDVESAGSFFPGYSSKTLIKNKNSAIEVIELHRNGVAMAEYIVTALESWKAAPSPDQYLQTSRKTHT